MYWEDVPGRTRPPYLDLCRETIEAQAAPLTVHCLDEHTIFEWLPDLPQVNWIRLGTPVRRSDYARTRLVERYGGLWLDSDCIAFSRLDALVAPLSCEEVVSAGNFCTGIFAARPHTKMMQYWAAAQDETLRSGDMSWAALGWSILQPVLAVHPCYSLPRERIVPLSWYEWRRFLSPFQRVDRVWTDNQITVMLYNAMMGEALAYVSRAELLGSQRLLSRLFRIALGMSSVEEETKRLAGLDDLRFTRIGRGCESWARHVAGSFPRTAKRGGHAQL
ncbi:MAG: capsular polysaccharide synthesis protein [Acidimicrobiales bacterium]